MKFIDLFAGLGGFHLALQRLGHTCVFASELDPELRAVYERNFGLLPEGDVRAVELEDIPSHDILCAGFPCQPFSKAGDQQGFNHPKWGDLFSYVLQIVRQHKPRYLMLENVPNLENHNDGHTWRRIRADLDAAGYTICHKRLSPHHFGIPQIRERMFIVGSRSSLDDFSWPVKSSRASSSFVSVLDPNPVGARPLTPRVRNCLEVWQAFLDLFPMSVAFPSFPIWSVEFGATYPYEDRTPYALGVEALAAFRGSHGRELAGSPEEVMQALPSYARTKEDRFPQWKINFIRQNRRFYHDYKIEIDKWLPSIVEFPPSLQKLEWNCKGDERDIWKHVIQFRASGVRVKKPNIAPSLIAMTTTQVPIIAWQGRYMTPRECARLQSMNDLQHLPLSPRAAFKALGNAVNVDLVAMIAQALLECPEGPASGRGMARQLSLPLIDRGLHMPATAEAGVSLPPR